MLVEKMLPRAFGRLAIIEAKAQIKETAQMMSKPHIDLVVVCERGNMVGVVTKTDIVGQISQCLGFGCTARIDSIMTRTASEFATEPPSIGAFSLDCISAWETATCSFTTGEKPAT